MSAATPASAAPASSMSTARRSSRCTILAVQAEGANVMTIEGLAPTATRCTRCRRRSASNHGLQCGFCTPGMVMSAIDLVNEQPQPDRARDPRLARRQSLPLHRLSQHRQGDQSRAPPPCGGASSTGGASNADAAIGTPVRRQGRLSLPHRPGHLHRRHQPAGPALRLFPAHAARPRRARRHRHGAAARRRRASSRSSPAPI